MTSNTHHTTGLLAPTLLALSGLLAAGAPTTDPTPSIDLQLQSAVDGGPWKTVPTAAMRVLPDGRIWLPYQDRHVRYRLQPGVVGRTPDLTILERGDIVPEGAFLTLRSTEDLENWRPLDANACEVSSTGLAMSGGRSGFWKLDFDEQIPDPTPLPPLQVEPNPEALFGSFPIPTIPGNGNPSFFGEFDKLPTPVYFPGEHAFNKYIFEERVHQHFEGDVKGYAVVLANEDGFQSTVSGGWARDPEDPLGGNTRMSTMRPGNIGSAAKLYSGVALMQLLEGIGPDINTALGLDILDYIPQRWLDTIHGDHAAISFQQILNHTSGLSDESTSLAAQNLQDNPSYFHFTRPSVGPGYSNENYRIMTYLIPRLADPEAMLALEAAWADADLDTYLDEVMEGYGLAFENYMENVFFPQIANCAPSADPANAYAPNTTALMYEDIDDTAGLQWSQKDLTGFARGQGGYWSSARELARFMQSVRYTDDLISPTASNLLLTGSPPLINNGSSTHAGFGAETGISSYRYKPGRQSSGLSPFGTGRGNAMFMPYDWVCASVINSDSLRTPEDNDNTTPSANTVAFGAILNAFYDATRAVPVTISKEAMTVSTFDDVAAYLRQRHMEVKWLDVYDIGGVPHVNAVFGDAPEAVAGQVGLTGDEYQDFLEEWVEQKGFAIQQVESYLDHGKIRYAAIITEEDRPKQRCFHGQTYAQHIATMNEWKADGFVPLHVSVVSLNGILRYTALYEQRAVGYHMSTRMSAVQYDDEFQDQGNQGRKVVSLNAYRHNGGIYYAAIWHTMNANTAGIHHATRDDYRAADATQLNAGAEPRIITGVDSGDQAAPTWARHGFGAIWR